MEIKTIENTKNSLIFEIEGADSNFCNLLRDELWNDDKVKISGFNVDHPLVGKPRFHLETTSPKKPVDALNDALARLKKTTAKLAKDIAK